MFIYAVRHRDRSYIGFTGKSLEKRRKKHEKDAKEGSPLRFHRALRKYGFDSFSWHILVDGLTKEQCTRFESLFIWLLQTQHPNKGFNMTVGGEGGVTNSQRVYPRGKAHPLFGKKMSEEARQAMSKAKKGNEKVADHCRSLNALRKGVPQSAEHRLKNKLANTGSRNHFFGKHHSEATKDKIRATKRAKTNGTQEPTDSPQVP